MKERLLIVAAALLAGLVASLALFWQPAREPEPLSAATAPLGGDFTVQSARGPVSLRDFRGKPVLIYFGYTFCPDICPTSLLATSEGLKQLTPAELAGVEVLFVSVDPRRDTPENLATYAGFFHPKIIGATARPEILADIARRYGVFYAEQKVETAGEGYVIDHSADTYVVDAAGRLAERIPHAAPPAQVASTIRRYLNHP